MFLLLNSSVTWALVWAHMGGDWDHMDDHMGGWGWGFAWLFVVLIVALVVWAVWLISRGGSTRSGGSSAIAVLEERFARGELSPEEYRERRSVLDQR